MHFPWQKQEKTKHLVFSKRCGVIAVYKEEALSGAKMQVGPKEGLMIFTDKNVIRTGTEADLEVVAKQLNRVLYDAGTHFLYVPFTNCNDQQEANMFGHLVEQSF